MDEVQFGKYDVDNYRELLRRVSEVKMKDKALNFGDTFAVDKFLDIVIDGGITSYDGHGYWGKGSLISDFPFNFKMK